ncbi:hypothetical protein EAG_11686, partial [Camponotus floridanus]
NGYPGKFIFNTITGRIKLLIHNHHAPQVTSSILPSPSPTQSFFVIPYIKGVSEHFKDIVGNLNKSLAHVFLNKLNCFIKTYKDPLPMDYQSNVVYKISCTDCSASYVGQTSRKISTRVREHQSNIDRPFENLSVLSQHRLMGHDFAWNDVKILDQDISFVRRTISEMIHIIRQNNSFNIQNDTEKFDKVYL